MNPEAPAVERAKAVCEEVRSDRRGRRPTIQRAQHARRRSRQLKLRTLATREACLEQRWHLWSAQLVAEAPTYVPVSWERARCEDDRILRDAARACDEVVGRAQVVLAAETEQGNREVLVLAAALGQVAAERMRAEREEAWVAVAGTARLLEQLDERFGRPGGIPDYAELSVACRSALRTLRLALARLHMDVGEP